MLSLYRAISVPGTVNRRKIQITEQSARKRGFQGGNRQAGGSRLSLVLLSLGSECSSSLEPAGQGLWAWKASGSRASPPTAIEPLVASAGTVADEQL